MYILFIFKVIDLVLFLFLSLLLFHDSIKLEMSRNPVVSFVFFYDEAVLQVWPELCSQKCT